MLRLVADENFSNKILRGLLKSESTVDIVRVQDVGFLGADDPSVLEWAAQEGRIVLTHDKKTMIGFAYERVRAGQPMPGVFVVERNLSIRDAIGDILLLAGAGLASEFEGQVWYVPL